MWLTLSALDVRTRLSGAELAALQSAALATGQSDPLPEIIAQVVAEVRGYIAGHRVNRLELNTATIPAALQSACLSIIRYRLITRLPGKQLLTEDRVKENEQALTLMRMVARGNFAIETPSIDAPADAQQSGNGIEVASAPGRQTNRQSLSRL